MSLIPLDEPRGDGPGSSQEEGRAATFTGRVVASTRAILSALPGVSALVDDPSESSPAKPADRGRVSKGKAPAALPSGLSDEGVEVVTTESEDTITIEAVDNPDAAISSDTWEPIER